MILLKTVFYNDQPGVTSQATFIEELKNRHPGIKINDIQEFLKNQEISQITTDIKKSYQYKITARPHTFQVDIFWFKRSELLTPILLLVDILSRKAFSYILSNKTQGNILEQLKYLKMKLENLTDQRAIMNFQKVTLKNFVKIII